MRAAANCGRGGNSLSGLILSAPAVFLLFLFLIVPILGTIYFSFFTYQS